MEELFGPQVGPEEIQYPNAQGHEVILTTWQSGCNKCKQFKGHALRESKGSGRGKVARSQNTQMVDAEAQWTTIWQDQFAPSDVPQKIENFLSSSLTPSKRSSLRRTFQPEAQ